MPVMAVDAGWTPGVREALSQTSLRGLTACGGRPGGVYYVKTKYSVTIAAGRHLFPSRTQQLSPPAPMVLPWQRGGRVGHRRVLLLFNPGRASVSAAGGAHRGACAPGAAG